MGCVHSACILVAAVFRVQFLTEHSVQIIFDIWSYQESSEAEFP